MSNQQLHKPRVNYPSAQYQEMAEDFIRSEVLIYESIPELVRWRKHLRDLRHIVTGSKTEQGHVRTLPAPDYGICKNLFRLYKSREAIDHFSSVDLISAAALVWPVYLELFAEGYVSTPLYPIPEFPGESLWKGKGLRFRLSLIAFTIKLLTAAINQLKKQKP